MIGSSDPWGRFARDLAQAGDDIEDLSEPRREASELLAAEVRAQAPYVTGYLVSTVYTDETGVGVAAIYAGVVHDSNPYAERAVDIVDVLDPFEAHVDTALRLNLKPLYA